MSEIKPRKLKFESNEDKTHPILKIVASLIALVGISVGACAVVSYMTIVAHAPKDYSVTSGPTPTPYYRNIALLGYGGGDHEGGALTDSMIVARIDDRAKKVFLISIPRDLWVGLPIDKGGKLSYWKINAAFAMGLDDSWFASKPKQYQKANGGGGNLAKYALEQVTGEQVNNFVAVSFKAFSTLIDSLGGITITRQTPFVDIWYPTEGKEKDTCGKSEDDLKAIEATMSGYLKEQEFACRYETLSLGIGTHNLDGSTALKYVRSRHSGVEGGDFFRSQRQRQVVDAIKEKVLKVSAIPKLIELASSMQQYVNTDFTLADIPNMVNILMSKKSYLIESIALTNENVLKDGRGPNGEYILIPKTGPDDFYPIHEYLQDRFYGLSEASASARFNLYLVTPTATPTAPVKKR